MDKSAVVLLSGGLDSATVLAIATSQGYEVHALSFDYGQRNRYEFECAEVLAERYAVKEHKIAKIDLRMFGGSSLTSELVVEKDRELSKIGEGIPLTYVPARNTIFLSFALAFAEVRNATNIFIGVNSLDCSGYPDCRPAYIKKYEELANLATRIGTIGEGIRIITPLIELTKAQIIQTGLALGVDYSLTSTCYDPREGNVACGHCDSCLLRLNGFRQLSVSDPARYS